MSSKQQQRFMKSYSFSHNEEQYSGRDKGNARRFTSPASLTKNVNTSISTGYTSNEGDNIKVYLRIRPPLKQIHEGSVDSSLCLEVTSPSSLTIATKPEPKPFSYDHVAGMETTQEEVFATVGKGIIEAFVNGFNGTIFAYGQTGSGKTFTMLGPADDTDNFTHELRGVIPRGFEYMFSLINRQQEKSGERAEFLARCSFLEIYNEQVFDLLEPSTSGLHLRENIKKGVFVEGLAERDISTAKDAYSVLQMGWLNRRVASTSMNRESSRSHAVFTVTLESKKRTPGGMNNIKLSKLHLVDLAGSERQKDTHAQDVRLKEAGSINKSLSALGNVIMSLVDIAHGKTRHVHYRDSKLTFILRDSLGGNAKTYIIANVHPSSRCFGETLSTLNFARRAKMIKNKAVVNEDVSGNVSELQAEIRKLKEQLSQFKSGNIVVTPGKQTPTGVNSSGAPGSGGGGINEWKEMMMSAIGERDQSENEKSALQDKVVKLEELCSKKEKFLQSTRMILKFRTDHISKLERQLKKATNGTTDHSQDVIDISKEKEIKLLREEIKLLQTSLDNHPEVKRFAMENVELRNEIKRLRALDPSNGDITKTMAEKHRYTLQLERQLRELINNNTRDDLSSSQQSLEASNAEVEKIKIEIAQLQTKLHGSQSDLKQSRESLQQASEELISLKETHRKRELELQSDLAAVRKSNNELERALETFQLKTAVERSAMNNLHMQTIKSLSSPIKFGSSKSTPKKKQINGSLNRSNAKSKQNGSSQNNDDSSVFPEVYVNDPNRFIGEEQPPQIMRRDSFDEMSDEEELRPFDWGDVTRDDEIVYIEALQDEIKQLQDLYNQSLRKIYEEQRKKIPLDETIARLTHKSNNLEEQLHNEKRQWAEKESECNTQIVSLRDKYKEAQGDATILRSELDDLRSLHSTIQKQLETISKEKDELSIDACRKYATLESKYVKLELDFFKLQADMDTTAESNNNLQVDFEQCKDELEFTRHKTRELEEILVLERKKITEKDEEINNISERLTFELENKIKLAQNDKEQELLHSVELITELRAEIKDLSKESNEQKSTIEELQKNLDHSKSALTAQQWKSLLDKEAVNNYLSKLDDMKTQLNERDNNIDSLKLELEESKQQIEQLETSCKEKKEKNHRLSDLLKTESEKLSKEKTEREKEVTSLQDEIRLSQDQCKELRATLEDKQQQLSRLQDEVMTAKLDLAEKTNTIVSLEEQLSASRLESSSFVFTPEAKDVPDIKFDEQFNELSEKWQASEQQSTREIEHLKRRCSEFEEIRSEKEMYESRISHLENFITDLEAEKTEFLQRESKLDARMKELYVEQDVISERLATLTKEKEMTTEENKKLKQQIFSLEMNLSNLQDDLEYNMDELEKTKALEEANFKSLSEFKSKLEVVHEEKQRLEKQLEEIKEVNKKLEIEHAKHTGHQNHNQRIKYHMELKKENLSLQEEIRKLRKQMPPTIAVT